MLKRSISVSLALMLVLFLLPLFCVQMPLKSEETEKNRHNTEKVPQKDAEVMLQVEIGGTVQDMALSDYLQGVVRAEMPAGFELEALKAQAVAARTYTYYQLESKKSKHESGAALCDEPSCCEAYISEEKARENWGEKADEKMEKIRRAVEETDGIAILYEGKPILAAFHSSSAERTEDAAAAWSASVPYLRPVESPESEETVPNYFSEKAFTEEEFRTLFLKAYPKAKLEGSAEEWIGSIAKDDSGYVETVKIGGVKLRGVEVRRIFSLRSACFTVTAKDCTVTFRTEGYGHGVGMSQYGANVLAKEGKDYKEILLWYYTDVTVEPYEL